MFISTQIYFKCIFSVTCACWRRGLRLRAAPPQLQLLGPRRGCLVPLGPAEGGQDPERLRDEALQALVGLLPAQRHLRRHHPLPLDDEDAFLTGAVLEPAVALVAFEPGQHAVVPTPRTLGGPLERGPGLRHRSPHVKVRGPVAIHSAGHKCVRGDARGGGVKWSQRWMDPHWQAVDRGRMRGVGWSWGSTFQICISPTRTRGDE